MPIDTEQFIDITCNHPDKFLLFHNFLSENDFRTVTELFSTLDYESYENTQSCIINDIKSIVDTGHVFSKLQENIDRLAKNYGLEQYQYYWEVAVDSPDFSNDLHTDQKNLKNLITLQWYIDIDDSSRNLYVSDNRYLDNTKQLNTENNSLLIFKASCNSYHGFNSGYGKRQVVRLRIKEPLLTDIIHDPSEDEVCYLIDAKHMGVSEAKQDLEEVMARFTYDSIRISGGSNIRVTQDPKNYSAILQNFKEQGYKKCVILMAGTLVTPEAIDFFKSWQGNIIGKKATGYYKRKTLVVDLEYINTDQVSGTGKYFADYCETGENFNPNDLGLYYVHPESNNHGVLYTMHRHPIKSVEILERQPDINDDDLELLTKISDWMFANVLNQQTEVLICD